MEVENYIIYALVGYGEKPLADYSDFQSEYIQRCQKYLYSIEANSSKGFEMDDFFIFYINENKITYLIMTDIKFSKAYAMPFLESIKKEFLSAYADTDLEKVEELGLNKEFKKILEKKYKYYNENKVVMNDSILKLKEELQYIKDEAFNTYYNTHSSNDRNVFEDKAEQLTNECNDYIKMAKKVRKRETKKKIYIAIGITVFILVILYVIISIICGSWTFQCGS